MARKKQIPYNDNNLAIAYYRYSSTMQDTSVEQQRDAAHKYAEAHGLRIIKEYDDPAISGTISDRPKFQQMLYEIKDIKPAALILWKTDRLARNDYDMVISKKIIRDAGCKIHYVAENTPDGSPESELLEGFLEKMATYYSKQLSVNIKRGQKFNYERGLYLGNKMLGYTFEGEGRHNKHYVIDPDTSNVVQRIFRMYVDGMSMAQIANTLNAEGRRTVRNTKFTTNGLRRILKNEAYIGIYRWGDFVLDNGMPALVSKELFDQAQERLMYNKKFGAQKGRGIDENGKPIYWLTGKLYCGECGASMRGSSGKSHMGTKYWYYICQEQSKRARGNGCKKKPVRKEWIENIICQHLERFLRDNENLASLAFDISEYYKHEYDDHGYLQGLKNELKDTERALDNIIKAIIAGASGERINNELNNLEERKKALQDTIEIETTKQSIVKDRYSIHEYFTRFANANMNDRETRDLVLDYFVDKIYLYDNRIVISCQWNKNTEEISYDLIDGVVKGNEKRNIIKRSKAQSSTTSCFAALGTRKDSGPFFIFRIAKCYIHLRVFQQKQWHLLISENLCP